MTNISSMFGLNAGDWKLVPECCRTNIFRTFWAQWWRLETSSRPFYDFIKITIARSDHLPIQMSLVHFSKKMKHWSLDIIGF